MEWWGGGRKLEALRGYLLWGHGGLTERVEGRDRAAPGGRVAARVHGKARLSGEFAFDVGFSQRRYLGLVASTESGDYPKMGVRAGRESETKQSEENMQTKILPTSSMRPESKVNSEK